MVKTGGALSSKALFNAALERVSQGELGTAAAICQDALRNNPSDVSMIALLGAVLLKRREPVEAEKYLRRSIELAPSFAKPHEDLGILLSASGRREEAIPLLENATRLAPRVESAWMALGRAYSALGRGADADNAFERAFALDPQRRELALATEHHQAGRYQEAEHLYRELLRANPRNVDAMRLLAGLVAARSMQEEAETLLRQVIGLAPDFALAYFDLGQLLQEQHRYEEAIGCYAEVTRLEPHRAKPHYLYGAVLAQAGKTEQALAAYRAALSLKPEHAGALLGLGHTLKTVGRQDEAVAAYRECIRILPDNGEIYWSLANLKTYKLSAQDLQDMESNVAEPDRLSAQSQANFFFALGKASEDAGNFDQAWAYYQRGNKVQRQLEKYDPVQTEITNDELIEVFTEDFLRQFENQGNPDRAPVFVVGLPRSGSTLIEQILASHSMVEGTAELPYLGRVATSLNRNRADGMAYPQAVRELKGRNFYELGQQYLDSANYHRHTDRPRFIDKNPNNFPTIGLLHLILPNAKIIDARRYPLDSTLSCYRQLFAKGQTFLYDLTEVGEYYLQYQRMMDHWHKVLPGRVLTVQYEDMVMDFEQQVKALLEFCELPWEDSVTRFYETDRPVRTASSEQVRQPVHSKSIHFWRNYEAHLDELIEVLEPILPRYQQYEHINR